MTIHEKLMNIQSELKAPKGQYNSFGKYKYRSCEDILEAVKPLLKDNKAALTITDDVINLGDRFYVKAIAKLTDIETSESIEVSALAREDEAKKGMDLAQITGSVSSYARKYALNGLFCIDDTKDSDTTNTHDKSSPVTPKSTRALSDAQIKRFYAIAKSVGISEQVAMDTVQIKYGVLPIEMSRAQYDEVCKSLEAKKG